MPAVWARDAFLLRQIHDFPRVIANPAGPTCTGTIHRMTVHHGTTEAVAAMCFTSLTAASAEIEGRSELLRSAWDVMRERRHSRRRLKVV